MSKKVKSALDEPIASPPFDPSVMVKLVSGDGHAFFVDRNAARVSKLLKQGIANIQQAGASPPLANGVSVDEFNGIPVISFEFLSSAQLQRAIKFMMYKYRYDADAEHRAPFDFGTAAESIEMLSVAALLQM